MGFHRNDVLDTYEYSRCQRWTARILLVSYLAAMAGLGVFGYFAGFDGLASNVADAPQSIQPYAALAQRTRPAMVDSLEGIAGTALPSSLIATRAIILETADLSLLHADIGCSIFTLDEIDSNISSLLTDIVNASTEFDTFQPFLVNMSSTLQPLGNSVQDAHDAATAVKSLTDASDEHRRVLLEDTGSTREELAVVQEFEESLFSLAGIATGARNTISSFNESFPEASRLGVAADGVSELRNDAMAGNSSSARNEREALLDDLEFVLANITELPDMDAFADTLADFNSVIEDVNVSSLEDELRAIAAAFDAIPTAAQVNTLVNTLTVRLDDLDLPALAQELDLLRARVQDLPDLQTTVLDGLSDFLGDVEDVVPCLTRAANATSRINATLVSLSQSLITVEEALEGLPQSDIQAITSDRDSVASLHAEIMGLSDLEEYRTRVLEADDTLGMADLDLVGKLAERFDGVRSYTPAINMSRAAEAVRAARMTLASSSAKIGEGVIADFRSFQADRLLLQDRLSENIDLVTIYNQGYCSGDSSILCASGDDCGSGQSCDGMGTRRCELSPTTSCLGGDVDCTGNGDRCLLDNDRLLSLEGMLQGFSKDDVDTPIVEMTMDLVEASFVDMDLDAVNASLVALGEAAAGIDITDIRDEAASIHNATVVADVQPLNTSMANILELLERFDFLILRQRLENAHLELLSIAEDSVGPLAVGQEEALVLQEFAETFLPSQVLLVNDTEIQRLREDGGAQALMERTLQIVDAVSGFLTSRAPGWFTMKPTDISTSWHPLAQKVGVIDGDTYSSDGAAQFFHAVINGPDDVVLNSDPLAFRVARNVDGDKYPNGRRCFSNDCLRREIQSRDDESIQEWSGGWMPVPLSHELLFILPMIMPGLIVLFGIGALISPHVCSEPLLQRQSTNCMIGGTFLFGPVMLLLGGGFLATVFLVTDVCATGPSVGRQYLQVGTQSVCERQLGGVGNSHSCLVSVNASTSQLRVEMNLIALFDGLTAGAGCDPAQSEDPLLAFFSSLSDSLSALPTEVIATATSPGEPTFRDPMRTIFAQLGADAGSHLADFVDQAGGNWSCRDFTEAYEDAKEPLCCDVVEQLVWYTVLWLGMGILSCTCGCTSGLFARKRLPTRLWGDAFESIKARDPLATARESVAASPLASPGGGGTDGSGKEVELAEVRFGREPEPETEEEALAREERRRFLSTIRAKSQRSLDGSSLLAGRPPSGSLVATSQDPMVSPPDSLYRRRSEGVADTMDRRQSQPNDDQDNELRAGDHRRDSFSPVPRSLSERQRLVESGSRRPSSKRDLRGPLFQRTDMLTNPTFSADRSSSGNNTATVLTLDDDDPEVAESSADTSASLSLSRRRLLAQEEGSASPAGAAGHARKTVGRQFAVVPPPTVPPPPGQNKPDATRTTAKPPAAQQSPAVLAPVQPPAPGSAPTASKSTPTRAPESAPAPARAVAKPPTQPPKKKPRPLANAAKRPTLPAAAAAALGPKHDPVDAVPAERKLVLSQADSSVGVVPRPPPPRPAAAAGRGANSGADTGANSGAGGASTSGAETRDRTASVAALNKVERHRPGKVHQF